MKISIGICDDEKYFREKAKEIIEVALREVKQEYEIKMYQVGKELMESKEVPDILLLDIEMPEMSGFEIAEALVDKKVDTKIIFVSNYEEMVFESIKFQPFRFIRKEEVQHELLEAIRSCVHRVVEEGEVITLRGKSGEITLRTKDIMYAEIYNHDVILIHKNGKEELRASLTELEKIIKDRGFVRSHNSYLVNMEYAYCILKKKIQLDNGMEIPVSRKYEEEVKNKFKMLAGFKVK